MIIIILYIFFAIKRESGCIVCDTVMHGQRTTPPPTAKGTTPGARVCVPFVKCIVVVLFCFYRAQKKRTKKKTLKKDDEAKPSE